MKVIKILLRIILYFITLFIAEIIIACIILFIFTNDIENTIGLVFFFNYLRLLFYSLPMLIIYLLYVKDFLSINIKYKPFLISCFNFILILFFTLMSVFIFDFIKINFFININILAILLGIFIAPMVVCLIPYYKNIVNKL